MPVAEEVPVIADVPVAEDIPVTEAVPVVVHGKLNALGVNVVGGMVNGRLRPPAPSSVEPIGIPTRPTDDTEPIPVGEEAEAAGPAKELPAVVGQVPDAFPTMPPPSNTVGDIEVPTVEVLVPVDVPAIELPMLDDEVPVPEAVTEIPRPKDDSGIEPPKPLHPVVVVEPDTVGVIGLTPGD